MTAMEQLCILRRQFPRSRELAVSRELLIQCEAEMVRAERYVAVTHALPPERPEEHLRSVYGPCVLRPLRVNYKDARLVLVTPA